MNWNKHFALEGQHAFLGASQHSWLNYDEDKLIESYFRSQAKQKGTELHEFAAQCIKLGQKLPRSQKTLNMYVNDAIGFKMDPEVILYYSDNCFGTADTISFRNNELRIHDLKTGITPAKIEQLQIYAALFCLEYRVDPKQIYIELRIYQFDKVMYDNPSPEDIMTIMGKIIQNDKTIEKLKIKEG